MDQPPNPYMLMASCQAQEAYVANHSVGHSVCDKLLRNKPSIRWDRHVIRWDKPVIRWDKPFYPMGQTFYPMEQAFLSDGTNLFYPMGHTFFIRWDKPVIRWDKPSIRWDTLQKFKSSTVQVFKCSSV